MGDSIVLDPQQAVSYRKMFMGCNVDCVTREATRRWIVQRIQTSSEPVLHSVINAGKVVMCHSNWNLAHAVNSADIVNADGQGVVWLGRLAGIPIPERVTGIDLMADMLQEADRHGWRVYLWGGTAEVVENAIRRISETYPNVGGIDGRHGYFDMNQEEEICHEISLWRPDIVFLGMSSPRKEVLAYERKAALGAKLIMGVGGAFDIWSGKTRRAPVIWQRLGAEWLYRLLQEPLRLSRRYLWGNIKFLYLWLLWIQSRYGIEK